MQPTLALSTALFALMVVGTSVSAVSTANTHPHPALITPGPSWPPNYDELKARAPQDQSSAFQSNRICGYRTGDGISVTCGPGYACRGTILPNRHAYQYCSIPGDTMQYIYTDAQGNWPKERPCPSSTVCCYSPDSGVGTALYISGGYTVTGFFCEDKNWVLTFTPFSNVLVPASFSRSLAQVPASTTATTTSSSPPPSNGGGGLSSGAVIGLGAGIGGGVGLLLIAGLAFFCYRRHKKNKERVPEVSTAPPSWHPQSLYGGSQPAQYSPVPPWNSPHPSANPAATGYGEGQNQYLNPYQQEPYSRATSPSMHQPYGQPMGQPLLAQPMAQYPNTGYNIVNDSPPHRVSGTPDGHRPY